MVCEQELRRVGGKSREGYTSAEQRTLSNIKRKSGAPVWQNR